MNVSSLLYYMYSVFPGNNCYNRGRAAEEHGQGFMDIPKTGRTYEIPVFLFDHTSDDKTLLDDSISTITVAIGKSSWRSRYRSFDKGMEDILRNSYRPNNLSKTSFTKFDGNYWGMDGLLFDGDLNIVMMCSWMVKKNGNYLLPVRPYLRLSKDCFIHCDDTLKRFLVNKLMPSALDTQVGLPFDTPPDYIVLDNQMPIKVEIDDIPFKVRLTDTPSISTSNEDLLKVALDNIEDIGL